MRNFCRFDRCWGGCGGFSGAAGAEMVGSEGIVVLSGCCSSIVTSCETFWSGVLGVRESALSKNHNCG